MNLVERFFAQITARRIRRGSYSSVDDLEDAIYDYLLQHNTKPKPFVWSKSAEDILTRERRALGRPRCNLRKSVESLRLRALGPGNSRRSDLPSTRYDLLKSVMTGETGSPMRASESDGNICVST